MRQGKGGSLDNKKTVKKRENQGKARDNPEPADIRSTMAAQKNRPGRERRNAAIREVGTKRKGGETTVCSRDPKGKQNKTDAILSLI